MKRIHFLFYRYRYLLIYILFGITSLLVELIFLKFFLFYKFPFYLSTILAFLLGLMTAFFLNVKYNFQIAKAKRTQALKYFTIISIISFTFQFILKKYIEGYGINIDLSRFIISGIFFLFSYILHRKLSFREFKKVGVAIYADGVEDIQLIYNRISNISDFIHIDIVDKSFNSNSKEVKAYRAEVVRAYWQKKHIEVHIMSKNPTIWIKDLTPYVDIIYIHLNIDENLLEVINQINSTGAKAGLVLTSRDSIEIIDSYIEQKLIKNILLLSIPNPGYSGQEFDFSALKLLEKLNNHNLRSYFEICVDGGVNDSIVKILNVESVVSGSYILSAPNPIKNIMHLQTSGQYS